MRLFSFVLFATAFFPAIVLSSMDGTLKFFFGDDRVLVENPENADIGGDNVSLSLTGGLPTNNSDVSPSTFPSGSPTAAPSKSEVVIKNNVPTGLPTMPQGNISYNS